MILFLFAGVNPMVLESCRFLLFFVGALALMGLFVFFLSVAYFRRFIDWIFDGLLEGW